MKLLIGWDSQDITPNKPVELIGQYYQRISTAVRDPLTVTAIALEQIHVGGAEQAVMASVDTVFVTRDFQDAVRDLVRARAPGLATRNVFLNATHIHSGPSWFAPFRWWLPAPGTLKPAEVRSFMIERTARAVVNAWKTRRPHGVSTASAPAAVGFCRRAQYADGRAEMYGNPRRSDFAGIEAPHDHLVRLMYTWDQKRRLTGVIVNVACPAQVMESQYVVTADFFGGLRQRIHSIYGESVHVLAQISAAGDQSPRNLVTQATDEPNYWDESGLNAIVRRLERAVVEGYASAQHRIEASPIFRHSVHAIRLPVRRATAAAAYAARKEIRRLVRPFTNESEASRTLHRRFVADVHRAEDRQRLGPFDDKSLPFVQLENAQAVMERYRVQHRFRTFPIELHALRVGNTALVTNPFELHLDFGEMIRAASPARQTFLVQLTCDNGGYLPTERAVAAGGYGALIINGPIGPDGGRQLVAKSAKILRQLWKE